MKYSLVIWDFNGTVLDDIAVSIEAINKVMSRRSMKLIGDKSEFQNIFCFPVKEYYRRLGFDFATEPFEIPADEWVSLYDEKKFSSPLVPGVKSTLETLKANGVSQIIMSASEKKLLVSQLSSLGVLEYFDDVIGTGDFYAHGKTEIAKRWAEKNRNISPSSILFVGDTDHDFESAAAIGCDVVLYSGGFMSKERLLSLGAPVIDDICRIIDIVL